jgi:hypothetical protein
MWICKEKTAQPMILKNLQNGGRGAYAVGAIMRTVQLCQHRMETTSLCQCPAMRGTRYCYSHHQTQARRAKENAERARQRWFESVPLDDAKSVQRALTQVITRMLSGDIGHKQAGKILYRLQSASVNLRNAAIAHGKADAASA